MNTEMDEIRYCMGVITAMGGIATLSISDYKCGIYEGVELIIVEDDFVIYDKSNVKDELRGEVRNDVLYFDKY